MRLILSVFLLLGTALAGAAGSGTSASAPATATGTGEGGQYAPGNTGQNRQHDTRLEAEDQSNAQADVELTRNIRRVLTDDAGLSMNAHNVKIITAAGRVTLRGPVDSEAERRRVEALARHAAGGHPVVNELEVGKR